MGFLVPKAPKIERTEVPDREDPAVASARVRATQIARLSRAQAGYRAGGASASTPYGGAKAGVFGVPRAS